MRGLIWRQWYLSKKNILATVSVIAGILLMEVMVRMSMRMGNLALIGNRDDLDELTYYLFTLINSLLCYTCFISEHGVTQSDYRAKWHLYSYTLPVSAWKTAGIKIGWIFAGFVLGTVQSLASLVILNAASAVSFDITLVWAILAVGLFITLMEAIKIPVTIRFKRESIGVAASMVFLMVLLVGAMRYAVHTIGQIGEMAETEDVDVAMQLVNDRVHDLLTFWGWLAPLLILAVFVLSYFATVAMLKRRVV